MDHVKTLRRLYDHISAHEIDAFGDLVADDGLVREHWGVLDQMAMIQQLGAGPG